MSEGRGKRAHQATGAIAEPASKRRAVDAEAGDATEVALFQPFMQARSTLRHSSAEFFPCSFERPLQLTVLSFYQVLSECM